MLMVIDTDEISGMFRWSIRSGIRLESVGEVRGPGNRRSSRTESAVESDLPSVFVDSEGGS